VIYDDCDMIYLCTLLRLCEIRHPRATASDHVVSVVCIARRDASRTYTSTLIGVLSAVLCYYYYYLGGLVTGLQVRNSWCLGRIDGDVRVQPPDLVRHPGRREHGGGRGKWAVGD